MAVPNTFADKTGEVLLGNLDYNFQVLDIGVINVNNSVTNLQTQVTSIDSRISSLESGTVDLTGYATETYVNNAINAISLPSLSGYATETYVNTQVSNLVNSAPSTLDTLNELAAALGDDANFSTTITSSIADKAPISNPTFTGTVSTGKILFNGAALIASDAGNPTGTNIDHIWHNDSPNNGYPGTWHFVSDTAYQADGNSVIKSGAIQTGPIAINDTDITTSDLYVNASADKWGVVIKKDFDSPDEPASLLIATDGDGTDDIAFEIRGNSTGSSVDVTNTFNSADTKFVVFGDGTTLIGYSNIGTTYTAPAKLAVSGSITATGDITAYFSDERLKTKLGNIENAIDKVNQLNGFYYEANDKAVELGYTKKKEVGLSAQEIEKVLPEIVAPAPIDPEYKTIHYERVVPLLVEAIKELTARVKELENK